MSRTVPLTGRFLKRVHRFVVADDVSPRQFVPEFGLVRWTIRQSRVNEPLAAGIPARLHGTIAVNGLRVADPRQEVLRARRIQASGLELQWPTRVVIGRVLVTEPRGTIERDHAGGLSTRDLLGFPADVSPAPAEPVRAAPALGVDVRETVVRDGAIA